MSASLPPIFSSIPHPVTNSSLLQWMNADGNDAVLLYAKHFGKIDEATSAIMTGIDLQGFQLRVTFRNLPPSSSSNTNTPLSPTASSLRSSAVTSIRIQFPQPLNVIDDATSVLTDMYTAARSALRINGANHNHKHNHTQKAVVMEHKPQVVVVDASFQNAFVQKPMLSFWVMFGLLAFYIVTFFPTTSMPLPFFFLPLRSFSLFLFRSEFLMRLGNYAAFAAHVGEAVYASVILKQMKIEGKLVDKILWVIQTFVLGFPSLTILLKIKRQMEKQRKGL